MAREGLRTLVVAKRALTEEQYQDFEVSGPGPLRTRAPALWAPRCCGRAPPAPGGRRAARGCRQPAGSGRFFGAARAPALGAEGRDSTAPSVRRAATRRPS